jgi:hypothetical protein
MVDKRDIDKSGRCRIVTRKLLSDIDDGMLCLGNQGLIGWEEYHIALNKIESLGRLCGIEYHRQVEKLKRTREEE